MEITYVKDGCQIGFWVRHRIDGWVWIGSGPDVSPEDDSEDFPEGELPAKKRRVADDILAMLGSE
jgi:hypothetical protein